MIETEDTVLLLSWVNPLGTAGIRPLVAGLTGAYHCRAFPLLGSLLAPSHNHL